MIQFPFYPPRPSGGPLSLSIYGHLLKTHMSQPKLNGDRVLVLIDNDAGVIKYANRHGSLYKFKVVPPIAKNTTGKCLFDGEVEGSAYYPFEALMLNGQDLRAECPSVRASVAKAHCQMNGIPWLFDQPTEAWLEAGKKNGKRWEGVVLKKLKSRYLALPTATAHTPGWTKMRW